MIFTTKIKLNSTARDKILRLNAHFHNFTGNGLTVTIDTGLQGVKTYFFRKIFVPLFLEYVPPYFWKVTA